MRIAIVGIVMVLGGLAASATTLHVGTGQPYPDPAAAAVAAEPGDTVRIHAGTYTGAFWVRNLHGTETDWITFIGESAAAVVFQGGSESMHFSDCTFLRIESLTVAGQTGNGMNIDDGGTYDSPTHHINVSHIIFKDMEATGNNDMLKLSGLEDFSIEACSFTNGATGGSGIDMVGCHRGAITRCTFANMGSNAIQAKGGTQYLRIERNTFSNAGLRSINLGGSTGLDFFRPVDASFEAADLQVYANIFEGSQAAVAYVGSVRVDVANNLIRNPKKWIFRILQETTTPVGRFASCGDNWFRNNVVLYDADSRPTVNIGPDTDPASFAVDNNLCFDGTPSTSSPLAGYPFLDNQSIVGVDPLIAGECPAPGSPVYASGTLVPSLTLDFAGKPWGIPPSRGACEYTNPTSITANNPRSEHQPCLLVLGYCAQGTVVDVNPACAPLEVLIYDIVGQVVNIVTINAGKQVIHCRGYVVER